MKRSIFMRLFDKLADWYVRRRFKNAIPDRFDPNRINVAVDKDRAMMAIEDYKVNIRILYLKHDSSELRMSDFFAFLLYDILNGSKSELDISEIHIDETDGSSDYIISGKDYIKTRYSPIYRDIVDPRCLVVVVVSKWGSDDWGRDLHQNFVNEIRLCKAVKDNVLSDFFFNADISEDDKERMSRKQNDMFLPFLLYECGIFNRTIKEKALSLGKSQEAVRKDYYYIDDDIWSFISDQTMKYIHPQIGEWDKMEEDIKKVFRQRINYIRRNLRS